MKGSSLARLASISDGFGVFLIELKAFLGGVGALNLRGGFGGTTLRTLAGGGRGDGVVAVVGLESGERGSYARPLGGEKLFL